MKLKKEFCKVDLLKKYAYKERCTDQTCSITSLGVQDSNNYIHMDLDEKDIIYMVVDKSGNCVIGDLWPWEATDVRVEEYLKMYLEYDCNSDNTEDEDEWDHITRVVDLVKRLDSDGLIEEYQFTGERIHDLWNTIKD